MGAPINFHPDTTVVTGSDRLARHLHERHARAQLAAGRKAWERPDILPVGAFWRRLARELQQLGLGVLAERRVLSRRAMQCRWEALVAESLGEDSLLQIAGAARSALEGWQLARDWLLDMDALALDPLEETRLLVEWGRRFESECNERGWLPEYALPDAVLGTLERHPEARELLPTAIQLTGFLEFSPRDAERWESLTKLGVHVGDLPSLPVEADAFRVRCHDRRDEILAAASWARELLLANPETSIAIVVPDLAAARSALRRALLDALAPELLLAADKPAPFNFSLGEPLANVALVKDALILLGAGRQLDFPAAARLARSPYLGDEEEQGSRLRMEAWLREGSMRLSLAELRAVAARAQCTRFAEALHEFSIRLRDEPANALPSAWARLFSQALDAAGWCRARPLDSAEFQAREAWNDLLAGLAELDVVLGEVTRTVAYAWLARAARETLFQPRAVAAPVQVLGLLEATGMRFDAVWVMGLDDETLPASPRPNPFLPIELQRAKQLPSASAERERAFARQVFEGLRQSAPQVIFSHPAREGDAERRPSPLLLELAEREAPQRSPGLAELVFMHRAEETFEDAQGPALDGGNVKGGVAILQDQSACAFRAFAKHRLRASEWPTPPAGPDAALRGAIVHRALELLWSRFRDRRGLVDAMERGEFEAVLNECVQQAIDRESRRANCWTPALRAIEIERLTRVLGRWFERQEATRPDFTVAEIEGTRMDGSEVETIVYAGPLKLRGKLDRVDRLADGREIIIDYKTGKAATKNEFFGERPRAPQLPAYALARIDGGHATPAGIAIASLRTGAESLRGIMRVEGEEALLPGMEDVSRTRMANWEEALAHWRESIDALGEAFARGEALVNPQKGACKYCHLALLCRINEQQEFAEETDDDE